MSDQTQGSSLDTFLSAPSDSQPSQSLSVSSSRDSSPLTDVSDNEDIRSVLNTHENTLPETNQNQEEITITSSPPPEAPLPAPLTSYAPPARSIASNSSRSSSRSKSKGSRHSSSTRSVVHHHQEEAQAGPSRSIVHLTNAQEANAATSLPVLKSPSPTPSISQISPARNNHPGTRSWSRGPSVVELSLRNSNGARQVIEETDVIYIEDGVQEEETGAGPIEPPLKRRRLSDSTPKPIEEVDSTTTTETAAPLEKPAPIRNAPPLQTFTCPICFGPPVNATMTPCGHICCGNCLFTAVKSALRRIVADDVARCPVCRAQILHWDGKGGGVIGLEIQTIPM